MSKFLLWVICVVFSMLISTAAALGSMYFYLLIYMNIKGITIQSQLEDDYGFAFDLLLISIPVWIVVFIVSVVLIGRFFIKRHFS